MPRRPAAVPPRAHTLRRWKTHRSEARHCGHCAPTGRDTLPTPRPVPRGRRAHARARDTFCHCPLAHRTSPTASTPCRLHCAREAGEKPPRRTARPLKPPPFFLLRATEHTLAAIVCHWCRRWALSSDRARDPPTTRSSSLDSTRAPTATHGLALPHISPETSPSRRHRDSLTASHRRALLRPSHRHGSTPRETHRSPRPFVCVLRSHLTAGELAHNRRGTVVNAKGISVEGPVCKDLYLGSVSTKSSGLQKW
jgi:hypothetical protein